MKATPFSARFVISIILQFGVFAWAGELPRYEIGDEVLMCDIDCIGPAKIQRRIVHPQETKRFLYTLVAYGVRDPFFASWYTESRLLPFVEKVEGLKYERGERLIYCRHKECLGPGTVIASGSSEGKTYYRINVRPKDYDRFETKKFGKWYFENELYRYGPLGK